MSKRDILVSKAREWIKVNDAKLFRDGYSLWRASKQFRIHQAEFRDGHFAALRTALEGWSDVDGPRPRWEGIGVQPSRAVNVAHKPARWAKFMNFVRSAVERHPDLASDPTAMAIHAARNKLHGANVATITEAMRSAGVLRRA